MVSSSTTTSQNPFSGSKLSSVVPANVTGDRHKSHNLTNMDLAMKLHYLKGVYLFKSEAVQGLTIYDLKKPMFHWLDLYYVSSGRIRRSETGRPFIKCNDSGIRILEARCDKTIEEWVQDMKKDCSLQDGTLVFNQVLGPDLSFSPLVHIQFTWFKCGGISVGLSWAHVLGDAFSASSFINMWGQFLSGHVLPKSLHVQTPRKFEFPLSIPEKPLSLKRVDPVGDYWLPANNCKMGTHSFHVNAKQLEHMLSTISRPNPKISEFEVLSAIIWKSLSRIRGNSFLKTVTICTQNSNSRVGENEFPTNGMMLGIVEANFSISEKEISELAALIVEKTICENEIIEEMLEGDDGKSDFIVYGANLTFVNMLKANIYELELKGHMPVFANYSLSGVGDEGIVLVLPRPKIENEEGNKDSRCTMSVVLPENQLQELKKELNNDWNV